MFKMTRAIIETKVRKVSRASDKMKKKELDAKKPLLLVETPETASINLFLPKLNAKCFQEGLQ